ncbi:hypothetical protein JOD62_000912 [Microbacterium keratanolyticum]|uniref:Uncharacterized protein n=1 Tax=Microbacterium keratanolyticum TaxID=67574 RepID=A0A9W6HQ56_9MICO|nr:hypothetical protein [Microbacterium keratanolyticum]MBM7468364.1 hypothetical protein [Microbacterium keratanolyticum]GLK00438.1 hypothetical protein GCM10017596_01530 [Microbacterium keratanolyticum]
MRIVAFLAGLILLISGGVVLVVADRARVDDIDRLRAIADAQVDRLRTAHTTNARLSSELLPLRQQLSIDEAVLRDTTGLLP